MSRAGGMGRREAALLASILACSVLFMATHDLVSQAYAWLIKGMDRSTVESF